MSRLSAIRQLDTSNTVALKRDLGRLVQLLEQEFADVRAAQFGWTIHSVLFVTSETVRALEFGTAYLCDTSDGDILVRLPRGTANRLGQRVAVIKTSSGNDVVVSPMAGQFVAGAASQSLGAAGVREYMWTGDTAARGWRLIS